MPTRRVGEKVPLVTAPIVVPVASVTIISGRGIPLSLDRRARRRRVGPTLLSAVRASLPWKGPFSHPIAHVALACTGEIARESSWPCSG